MSRAEYVALAVIVIFAGLLVFAAVKLKRRCRWEWLHPPEDDDGVSLLEDDHHANH